MAEVIKLNPVVKVIKAAPNSAKVVRVGAAIITNNYAGGGGVTDGNKGDITLSGGGTNWQLNANAVTLADLNSATYSQTSTPSTLAQRDSSGNLVATGFSGSSFTIPNVGLVTGVNFTAATTASNQVADSFSTASYRTVDYIVQIEFGSSYQCAKFLLTHDGTTPDSTRYADLFGSGLAPPASPLATIAFSFSGTTLSMLVTPANAGTNFKIHRIALAI
jgi:hypothetical protein